MKEELFAMIRWWLEKCGRFRKIDAIINIKKDPISRISRQTVPTAGFVPKMVVEVVGRGGHELLEELR